MIDFTLSVVVTLMLTTYMVALLLPRCGMPAGDRTWLFGQLERSYHLSELRRLTQLGSASLQVE
jgi:hypothetical protein